MLSPPCLVCGKELENMMRDGNQPSDGLEFTSFGHYGSTVFDPIDGTGLAFNICDKCLTKAGSDERVLSYDFRAVPSIQYAKYKMWKES